MAIIRPLRPAGEEEHDPTFVTPNTVFEVTDRDGNKSNVAYKDMNETQQKAAREKKGTTGYTPVPTVKESVESAVTKYTPTIKLNKNGDGLVLSGTKEALNSSLAKDLRKYLKSALSYQDLKSANTAKIIETVNADIKSQIEQSVVENGLNANYDDYKDYAHAVEVMSSTNPLNKSGEKNKIAGYEKGGTKKVYKTPQEWLNYFQEQYNPKERADLFVNSYLSQDSSAPNLASLTPYLVMSGGRGGDTPLYGFSAGDKILAGVQSFMNESSAKLIEGGAKVTLGAMSHIINADGYRRRDHVNAISEALGAGSVSSQQVPWLSEEEFDNKTKEIIGKKYEDLTEDDKRFIATAISDKYLPSDKDGLRVFIANEDGVVDDNFLDAASYDSYINARDNISTIEKYDSEIGEVKKQFEKGRSWLQDDIDSASIYSPIEVGAGRFAGTIARFMAESGAITGLTGGLIPLNQIGDKTLGKVVELAGWASGKGIATAGAIEAALKTPVGFFLGSIATEIPEDILQTAVDNVLLDNAEENKTLLTPDNIEANTLQNLTMRLIFTPIASAVNTVQYKNALKRAQKESGLAKSINIDGLFEDNAALKAAAEGGRVSGVTADGKFKIVGDDGVEKVLDNTYVLAFRDMDEYPVLQNLAEKFNPIDADVTVEAIERAKKAVGDGEYSSNVRVRIEPLDVDFELARTISNKRYPGFDIEGFEETVERGFIGPLDKTTAGAPTGYSSLKDYYNKAKGQTVSVIEMSPRDYLYNSYPNDLDEWSKYEAISHSVEQDPATARYAEAMANGDRFPLVYLDYDKNGFAGQEGRHRAVAAQRNGIDTIPVLVRHPVGTDPLDYLLPSKNYSDVTEAFSDFVTVARHSDAAIIEGKTKDIYRATPSASTSEINVEGSYRFVDMPYLANKIDDAVTVAKVDTSEIVSTNEVSVLMKKAAQIVGDSDSFAAYVKTNGESAGEILERITEGDVKAIAEYYNRPIVVLDAGSESGVALRDYHYFPGIKEDFDKQMSEQLLASTTTDAPSVDASNISMSNTIENALETQPYDKTITEIVADKYKMSGPISDAPNSASMKWETPGIEGEFQDLRHAMAAQPTNLTMDQVNEWFYKTRNTVEKHFRENIVPKFEEKYPTTTDQQTFVRNMHYLFDLQKMDGLTVQQAIGKSLTDIDGTKLEITQADVDFYNEVLAPYMKELRDCSITGLGIDPKKAESMAVVGYLPHTSYSPMDMGAEEAMQQGTLWRKYSGASASTEDGNFTTSTLIDSLDTEFRIFADNMIWDSLGDKAIVAKYMSELHADGVETSAENVQTMVKKQKALSEATSKSSSAKKVTKYLTGPEATIDWKTFNAEVVENAKNVGAIKAIQEAYSPIYGKAKDGAYQSASAISVQQTSDVMRRIITPDGDMYSNGGRMVVAGAADAGYMAKRIFDQAKDGEINAAEVRQMFADYLSQSGRRTKKGAEYVADQWMKKIAQDVGETGNITQRALTSRLNSLIYFEGSSRLKRWVARADLDKINAPSKEWMNEFFYRQGLLSRQINSSGVMNKINSMTNKLISARMKSLFWLNFKNGVLQASECVRIFTEFKMGDALKTIGRLASDAEFRNTVDDWVDLLVPEKNFSKSAEAIDVLADIAKKSEIVDGDIQVGKLTKAEENTLFKKIDDAAMTPVDLGENSKNRILIAGILQEGERKGYTGDQLFNFVNKKFERIGLANNDLGRLAGADNPLFRLATNLKSFSIRQVNMYINNIKDMNGGEIVGYIIKNLGWKVGIATILAKLGYSVPQSLGIDPFGILDDDYTGVDEDDYNAVDKIIAGPAGRALLSGGFTSYLADAYWAARQTYESKIATPSDEVDRKFQERGIFELAMPSVSFDNMLNIGAGFIPGYTQGKRVIDMADLMKSGWAVSTTGNIMYAAPTTPEDVAAGFLFGRSNTSNARTYYQTADPLQGLVEGGIPGFAQQFFGRGLNLGGGYRNFDPVDTENYTDWFYGDSRDDQQWNAGYYYFRELAQRLQTEYQNALANAYSEDERNKVYDSYNAQLRELDDKLVKFTKAYQDKNGGKFDANKMNNLLTVMRTYRPTLGGDQEQRDNEFYDANNAALQRYTAAGLPQQISYKYTKKDGTQVEYSPQVRAAMQGRYGLPEEAARIIKQVYTDKWKDLNKEYRNKYYNTKNSKQKKAIQSEYFNLVRKDLDPIVALYGASIFSNDDVEDVMEDVFNSMMPYGQSSKKYLQEKYEKYYSGTIEYSQPGNETVEEIKKLLNEGKTGRGKALARTLLQRVQENRQALTRDELEWLQGVLK